MADSPALPPSILAKPTASGIALANANSCALCRDIVITGDLDRRIEILKLYQSIYPRDAIAHINLAVTWPIRPDPQVLPRIS